MEEVAAKAFLSYAHADDERERGRISWLATLIREEFETLTGTTIEIFLDSAEIRWGQNFRARLDESLQETTFFIPVLTPTYFLRDECRKEMRQFTESAQALGLDQLLMSIRYVPMSDLREDSSDELKALAATMQWEPWDQVRLLDEDSHGYRTAIHRLAVRLVELTRELEITPVGPATTTATVHPVIDPDDAASGEAEADSRERPAPRPSLGDDEPGFLDIAADIEPAMAEWAGILTALPGATTEFTDLLTQATSEMNSPNSSGGNAFARRVQIARRLAADGEEPVAEIERLSKEYSRGLLRIDRGIQAILEVVIEQPQSEGAGEFLDELERMIGAAAEASRQILGAADSADEPAKLSRDLRPLFRRWATAMRNIADGMSTIDAWLPLVLDGRRAIAEARS